MPGDVPSDTCPVRPSEALDWGAVERYLRAHLPDCGAPAAPMAVEQFPSGHSNLTYLVRFGDREYVLRRPPLGPVAPRAHDMAREHGVLAALHPVFPLAPRPLLVCDDPSVVGATFYVMERRRGYVIRDEEPPCVAHPAVRAQVSAAVVDTLADLHALDLQATGLAALGRPAGFVERQVRGWTERWDRARTAAVAEMDELAAWLAARRPADTAAPALLHGDYKLDNVMLDWREPARPVAVLDWEMSAPGDPRVDLGILLCYWVHAVEAAGQAIFPITTGAGWFSRAAILDRYAARSGRDLAGLEYFEVFAVFKLAVVIQQIFHRYHRGQTDDARFAGLDRQVARLARAAARLAGRVG